MPHANIDTLDWNLSQSVGGKHPINVALDPKTPADVLRRLAEHPDTTVRRAVAQNPNAPIALLFEVAATYPRAFLKNPACELLSLEDPAFLEHMPRPTLRSVLAVEETPLAWVRWAAAHAEPEVRRLAAANPRAPADLLQRLARDTSSKVRERVAGHAGAPRRVMLSLALDEKVHVRARLAERPGLPARVLLELTGDPSEAVRQGVASNRSASVETLEQLAVDPAKAVRREVALRREVPVHVLLCLLADPDAEVRRKAAHHQAAPWAIAQGLTESTGAKACRLINRHPGISTQVLKQLARPHASASVFDDRAP